MPEDRIAIQGLLKVLQPLQLATEAMSKAAVPLLADEEPAKESTSKALYLGFESYMDNFLSSVDTAEEPAVPPVHTFVHATPVYNTVKEKHVAFNLLTWWYGQRAVGNEENGLTQMALDVLCAPASSMDVECAFSFAGSVVSKRHHNLSPYTIQATMTLSSYSKAGLIRPGIFDLLLHGRQKANKGAAKPGGSDSIT
ncbi:hypothetical protein FRC10_007798 [Ceratobasidium sp. 414]|nr:hypothetical protein FRC10_007798 [Ceratobasidium sp. 414]